VVEGTEKAVAVACHVIGTKNGDFYSAVGILDYSFEW
jgi:hypothetical protein